MNLTSTKRCHWTYHGFTLVELVITVTVIGVLTLIALPQIDLDRYRVDGAMRGIATTILAAQRIAVTRHHDVVVRFDLSNRAIVVHEDANNDGMVGDGERVRSVSLGEAVAFGRGSASPHPMGPSTVSFTRRSEGLPAVTFHRSGSASEAGGVYITSRRELNTENHPSDTRVLEIDRATGRVSWYRFDSSAGWQRGY